MDYHFSAARRDAILKRAFFQTFTTKKMTQKDKILHLKKFLPSLPDNLSVGGSLDLRGTQITSLPDNLSVGGWLDLSGTQIAGAVYGCGDKNRVIISYNHPIKGLVVSLGCFVGTEKECIDAINEKYGSKEAKKYIAKVKEAFAYKQSKT